MPTSLPSDITNHPMLNSRPGAAVTIELNFVGLDVNEAPGLRWNGYPETRWPRFSTRGVGVVATGDWTNDELRVINELHAMVSEVFKGWDINVTTVPGTVMRSIPPGRSMRCTLSSSQVANGLNFTLRSPNFASSLVDCVVIDPSILSNFTLEWAETPGVNVRVPWDYLRVVVHEIGHCLGMAHNADLTADGEVAREYGYGPYPNKPPVTPGQVLLSEPETFKAVPVMGSSLTLQVGTDGKRYTPARAIFWPGYASGKRLPFRQQETDLIESSFNGAAIVSEADRLPLGSQLSLTSTRFVSVIAHQGGTVGHVVSVTATGTLNVAIAPAVFSPLDYTFAVIDPSGTEITNSYQTRYATADGAAIFDTSVGSGRASFAVGVTPGRYVLRLRSFGRDHDRGTATVSFTGVAHTLETSPPSSLILLGVYVRWLAQGLGANVRMVFDRPVSIASAASNRASWIRCGGKRLTLKGSLAIAGNVVDTLVAPADIVDSPGANTASLAASEWGASSILGTIDPRAIAGRAFKGVSSVSIASITQPGASQASVALEVASEAFLGYPIFVVGDDIRVKTVNPDGVVRSYGARPSPSSTNRQTVNVYLGGEHKAMMSVEATVFDHLGNSASATGSFMQIGGAEVEQVEWIGESVSGITTTWQTEFTFASRISGGDPIISTQLVESGSASSDPVFATSSIGGVAPVLISVGAGSAANKLRVSFTFLATSTPSLGVWDYILPSEAQSPLLEGRFIPAAASVRIRRNRFVRVALGAVEELPNGTWEGYFEITADAAWTPNGDEFGPLYLVYFASSPGYRPEDVDDFFFNAGLTTFTEQVNDTTARIYFSANVDPNTKRYLVFDVTGWGTGVPFMFSGFANGFDVIPVRSLRLNDSAAWDVEPPPPTEERSPATRRLLFTRF